MSIEKERDALAAELAAIRAAGGEQVEVVGYGFQHVDKGWLFSSKSYHEVNPCLQGFSLMTVAQHQRIVAAMAAELEQARRTAEYWKQEHLAGNAVIEQLRAELEAARKQEPQKDCEWCAGAGHDYYGEKCQRCLPPLAGKVSVRRELLKRALSTSVSGMADAVAARSELAALLATPSMEVKS